jgi:hypothetical protein
MRNICLHPDCRLAVFDEIPIRHLIRPSPFRHACKGRFEARPGPISPKQLTKGQRLDAPDLLKPQLPWPLS